VLGKGKYATLLSLLVCIPLLTGAQWVVATELNKAIPELLRRFYFTTVNPLHPADIKSAGFYIMHGFDVVVTARTDN
jgi:hypothetical protein